MRLNRVVVGMDFSKPAEDAARWVARDFAPGAELVLVHVVAVPEPPRFFRGKFPPRETLVETAREGADRRLRELSTTLGAERIWLEIREGDPAEQIDSVASEYDADVVVVGPHGARPGIWDRPGGTAEKILRESRHTVLLAANPREGDPLRVLVPLDESAATPIVLDWAARLASRPGAEVTLLHVVSSTMLNELMTAGAVVSGVMMPVPDDVLTNAEMDSGSWLARLAADAGLDASGVKTEVKAGDPADQILAAAQRLDAELIVMGSSSRGIRAALLGSVAREVIRSAKRPVLVARGRLEEASAETERAERREGDEQNS